MIRGQARCWWALLTIAAAFTAGGCTTTAEGSAAMVTASVDVAASVQRSATWLATTTCRLKAGCSAAAEVDGVVVWAAAQGLADIGAHRPLTTSTRFDIAAAGDQFTATAILLLVGDGKLQLTDALADHLSGLPAWAEQVTLSHLLHQNSGAPAIDVILTETPFTSASPATEQDALELVKFLEPRFTPGAFFEANETNYLLLAEVAQAESGQSLPEFLRTRVFAPAGVDIAVRPQDPGDRATSYESVLGQLRPSEPIGLFLSGRGLMFATPSELVRWADNYRTGVVGGPDLLAATTRDAVPIGSNPGVPRNGAGIYIRADGSLEAEGDMPGGETYVAVSPDRRTAIAFSCNQSDRSDQWARRITDLRQIWFGIP